MKRQEFEKEKEFAAKRRKKAQRKGSLGSLVSDFAKMTTAKGLRHKAQGCHVAITLGESITSGRNPNVVADLNNLQSPENRKRNPFRVAEANRALTQGSRKPATLGFVTQPLRGCKALALILILTMCAFAQNSSSITGRVIDQQGASVAGAEVRLRSRTGALLLATSDHNGAYSFRNVTPGDYALEVKADGFAAFTSNELKLARGQSLTNDVKLSVEAVSESVIVTASGTAQRIDEISKAVSVLDAQTIEARRELTLPESLRGIPGIRVQQQGSIGALTSVRMRGQRNFDTAILLDGLRVRDASDINGSAVVVIPDLLPADLDRVEVLRGSGSSIYGTNAIGGVINLVPRTGTGRSHFEFGFDGGGLGLFRERIRAGGGIGKRAGYSFGLTRLDVRHGVDGNDEYGNSAGTGRFQFSVTPTVMISANFYGTIANGRVNDSPFALPAAFAGGLYPAAVAGVTFHPDLNNPDEGRRNRVLVGSVRLSQQVNDKLSYSIAYQHVGNQRRNYNGPRIDPKFAQFYPFGDFAFAGFNNGKTDTLDGRANLRLGEHNLATAGFEYERESIFQSSIPSFSAVNNTTDRQRTFAVFGQDQIFLLEDRLQISVGVRGQYFSIRAADRPGSLGAIKPERSLTGDGSVAYFFRESGTKLRAHVGNGFRAPSLFERFGQGTFSSLGFKRFGDPTLRAEQSISFDAGFDQRIAKDRARFGATYFYTHLKRVIAFNNNFGLDPLGLGRFSGYENRAGGFSRGLETYLEAAPWRNGNLHASYTYTNSDRLVSGRGRQPEYVIPRHLLGISLTHRYRSFLVSFDLNRTGAYIAPVFENDFPFRTAELTFPGYTKADLFGSYERRLSEQLVMTLFAGADNLFNAKYFENGFRAPGIVGRGGVNFRFR
ncbi:MAG: vitamin transporter [Blastocatellia bacterium]|jgi:iron complex outermembrane receptor protein|nr:vitamin transporter [Blastocatellia bacterium]